MRSNTFSFVNAWLTFCIVIAFWNVNKNDNFNEFLLLAWDLLASASVRVLLLLRIFKLLKSTRYNYLTNLNSSIHMTGTTLPQIRELEWDGRHNYSPGTAYGSEPRCLQWNRKPRYNLLAHINTSVSLISKQGKITFKLKQTGVVVEDNSVGLLSVGQVIFSTLENCWQFECFKRSFFFRNKDMVLIGWVVFRCWMWMWLICELRDLIWRFLLIALDEIVTCRYGTYLLSQSVYLTPRLLTISTV